MVRRSVGGANITSICDYIISTAKQYSYNHPAERFPSQSQPNPNQIPIP